MISIRKPPEPVVINLGKIRLLDSLKADLDLYIEFLAQTQGQVFRVCDVLLGCLEKEVTNNGAFRKFKARQAPPESKPSADTPRRDTNLRPMPRAVGD